MATKCSYCLTFEHQNSARVEGPASMLCSRKGKTREGQDVVLNGNILGLLGRLKVPLLFSHDCIHFTMAGS